MAPKTTGPARSKRSHDTAEKCAQLYECRLARGPLLSTGWAGTWAAKRRTRNTMSWCSVVNPAKECCWARPCAKSPRRSTADRRACVWDHRRRGLRHRRHCLCTRWWLLPAGRRAGFLLGGLLTGGLLAVGVLPVGARRGRSRSRPPGRAVRGGGRHQPLRHGWARTASSGAGQQRRRTGSSRARWWRRRRTSGRTRRSRR